MNETRIYNPVISRFFRQIGLAEELGSGVRKLARFGKVDITVR